MIDDELWSRIEPLPRRGARATAGMLGGHRFRIGPCSPALSWSCEAARAALHLEIRALRHSVQVLRRSRPLHGTDATVWEVVAHGVQRATACKAPRQPLQARHRRQCGICNLHNPKGLTESESHPLRHNSILCFPATCLATWVLRVQCAVISPLVSIVSVERSQSDRHVGAPRTLHAVWPRPAVPVTSPNHWSSSGSDGRKIRIGRYHHQV